MGRDGYCGKQHYFEKNPSQEKFPGGKSYSSLTRENRLSLLPKRAQGNPKVQVLETHLPKCSKSMPQGLTSSLGWSCYHRTCAEAVYFISAKGDESFLNSHEDFLKFIN